MRTPHDIWAEEGDVDPYTLRGDVDWDAPDTIRCPPDWEREDD